MSFAAAAIIETLARLRLALEAINARTGESIKPEDVRLDDIHPVERARLIAAATDDFWKLIATPTTEAHADIAEAIE